MVYICFSQCMEIKKSILKFNFYIFIFFIFLNSKYSYANKVDFLLQSAADPNKVELITNISKQNILYLQPKCINCLENTLKLLSLSKINFIIVVGTKPIDNLFQYLNRNKVAKNLWQVFYFDPGLNYGNKLKILESNSVFIAQRFGQTKMNFNIDLSKGFPKDSQLGIWK